MTTLPAVLVLAAPLVVFAVVFAGFQAKRVRSPHAALFGQRHTPSWSSVFVFVLAAVFFAVSGRTRGDSVAFALVAASVVGAAVVERKLLTTYSEILRFYLDPTHWTSLQHQGARWRYEMQHVFATDPEHVDGLIFDLIQTHGTLEEFLTGLDERQFPPEYDEVLRKRLWGFLFQTVERLASEVVPNEVIENRGRFSSGKARSEVFAELRDVAQAGQVAFMDRWQYYWCLRNLNVIDQVLRRTFRWEAQLAGVAIGSLLYGLGFVFGSARHHSPIAIPLGTVTAGALLWLLVVCAGASLFLVTAFRGTGTFSISSPSQGEDYDPLWSDVIQVGIVAFTVSFVIYGIGGPFFLDPAALSHFHLNTRFLLYSCGSFLFCGLVFAGHVLGVHELMSDSRANALARTAESLAIATTTEERKALLDHFADVRRLRVWPLRGATVAQLAAGILLPIVVQAILLYSGLRSH